VPPAHTPGPAEHRTTFDSLKLHRIFGCRRFKNQNHLIAASSNAQLIKSGELPPTLGDFATINSPAKGKPLLQPRKYLDKVHLDIVFGDCLALGGFRYAIVLVDVATRYCWVFGMQALTSNEIISALNSFTSIAGMVPKTFHSDFDQKLIGGKARQWILEAGSRIIAAPSNRQSSNGLVERSWQTMVRMARAYITEKQVGREFWYFAIRHAAQMMNQVPGRLGRKLTSPFELVHGVKPNANTWFELFSIGYFPHHMESNETKSKMQAQTMDGIAVGRDELSNTILFYNPVNKQYYRPPIYKLDEGRLPISTFPKSIRFDGGLTCGLLRHKTDPTPEPFPPGTRVSITQSDKIIKGTISNVPLPFFSTANTASLDSDESTDGQSTTYVVQLDDGKTIECDFSTLAPQITSSSLPSDHISSATSADPFDSLPYILKRNSKITLDHQGAFHKGYLDHTFEGGFVFAYKRAPNAKKPLWTVPLPDFSRQWYSMVAENIIIPGHSMVSSFLRPNTSNNSPSLNHVSAKNLLNPCPPSLAKALHPDNPDRLIWLESYKEEKGGLESLDVYEKISKKR
jgi:transposase InsO family protein